MAYETTLEKSTSQHTTLFTNQIARKSDVEKESLVDDACVVVAGV